MLPSPQNALAAWCFDVMDMHYVPNLTVGPMVLEALRPYVASTPVHAHLMVAPVAALIAPLVAAGAASITFHLNVVAEPLKTIAQIQAAGCQAGLAINPNESLTLLEPFIGALDRVLLMSVVPGLGGQSFIAESMARLRALREMLDAKQFTGMMEVDGGVNLSNCAEIATTGVQSMVMGTGLFGLPDHAQAVRDFASKVR